MNKKFSTLLASFLLAGGVFSSAEAINISQMQQGEYYKIEITNGSAQGFWLDGDQVRWYSQTADTDGSCYWTAEAVKESSTGIVVGYKLKNAKGKYYVVTDSEGNTYDTFAEQTATVTSDGTIVWWAIKVANKDLYAVEGNAVAAVSGKVSWGFKTEDDSVDPISRNADWLNKLEGDGFHMTIGYQQLKDNNTAVDTDKEPLAYTLEEGNVFDGKLYAADKDNNGKIELYQGDANGKRIVLTSTKWESIANNPASYKFDALTNTEYTNAEDEDIVADEFTFYVPVAGAPIEVVATDGTDSYELLVTGVNGKYYLTVSETNAADGKASYTFDASAKAANTYVWFGASNLIDYTVFYDKLLNITREPVDGGAVQVASPVCNNGTANNMDIDKNVMPVAQVALAQPEGQWLWNGENFVNRESGNKVTISGLRTTEEANVYTDGEYNYTIVGVGTPGDNGYKGYFAEYDADALKMQALLIGTPIASTGDTVYMTLGDDNQIQFSTDKANAIEFRLTQYVQNDLTTIKHFTEYLGYDKDEKVVTKVDTLNFYQYNLTDAVSGKILAFDNVNLRYILKTAETTDKAINIVLKEKNNDDYNILIQTSTVAEKWDKNSDDPDQIVAGIKPSADQLVTVDKAFCSKMQKLYGAHNANELVKSETTYKYVENDIFVIANADAYQYRPVEALDTIKVFRNVDENYVLYEAGTLATIAEDDLEGFLAIQNFLDPDYAEKNPAMLADTAAGYGTWRPQYLLAVDATIVPEGKWCEEHQSSTCAHAVPTPGYVEGRYLVGLADSVTIAEREDCAFQNYSGEKYYRLGFVHAKHIADSLIIASNQDTIILNDNTKDEYATFAFRYVDTADESFIIETLYNREYWDAAGTVNGVAHDKGDVKDEVRGYVKFHNGVPVVTKEEAEAEVFNLEVLENIIPTANEDIAVEEGVEVIAGNGAVTIQGAAGKTVVITNILGKAVANTTLTSDNQTINVPAGIVVVTVDGEAVKAIVK